MTAKSVQMRPQMPTPCYATGS